ncbi:MAG: four-carbon acid sugar kinase family protein [Verrucomicrobia bacterium]|jgi:uncharacterized protein YgbK (DUF1537 family)|nr:four-carbon acid sugar kinase family protein [Verrucomicrobiota bacterium]
MNQKDSIQLAYFGDDFTGSTDALEFMTRAGADTILFIEPPTPDQWAPYAGYQAFGVAGLTRAMPPDEMEPVLETAFARIREIAPRHLHYKVCSTFDSSPEIGSIGTAIGVGRRTFGNPVTPVVVGAPHLGRYVAFGNLFARMGIGSTGEIHRLDRHPSMRHHPTTPADEADLRLHLARQCDHSMGLIDLVDLELPAEALRAKIEAAADDNAEVLFFDGIYEPQMARIGAALETLRGETDTLFSVGSSGVEKALGDHWGATGKLTPRDHWTEVQPVDACLVLSGSVSPITADQIRTARDNGFAAIAVAPEALESERRKESLVADYAAQIAEHLRNGRSVVLHSCEGPDDPRLDACREILGRQGLSPREVRGKTARVFGEILGGAARRALEATGAGRLVVAGGDTSSIVARALGIEAVEMIAPLYPGAPLCRAFAPDSPVDQMEINLKGGQVGDRNYFPALKAGKL